MIFFFQNYIFKSGFGLAARQRWATKALFDETARSKTLGGVSACVGGGKGGDFCY